MNLINNLICLAFFLSNSIHSSWKSSFYFIVSLLRRIQSWKILSGGVHKVLVCLRRLLKGLCYVSLLKSLLVFSFSITLCRWYGISQIVYITVRLHLAGWISRITVKFIHVMLLRIDFGEKLPLSMLTTPFYQYYGEFFFLFCPYMVTLPWGILLCSIKNLQLLYCLDCLFAFFESKLLILHVVTQTNLSKCWE